MSEYKVPTEFYFRLHHIRPRFKNDVENVLGYMSFGISALGALPTKQFNALLDDYISSYENNANAKDKTIQNWRTEIAALFGMYIDDMGISRPSLVSDYLANTSNLTNFFKGFLYSFQYPGGHLKSNAIAELLNHGIAFHPARWLARYFTYSEYMYLTKAEFCHCVLNDMRVTRDNERMFDSVARIDQNRKNCLTYDNSGDVVRYAGDLLDYMVLADWLEKSDDGQYRCKHCSHQQLIQLAQSSHFFEAYCHNGITEPKKTEVEWFYYTERCFSAYVQAKELRVDINLPDDGLMKDLKKNVSRAIKVDTNQLGEEGEGLTLEHEKIRVRVSGREDLVHLIKRMPTHLAVGYDIKSIEVDSEEDRFIEVKTTVSKAPLHFNRIHLTTNEWRVAESSGDKYFIYRLQINDSGIKLFLLRNPVRKYKLDQIRMIPRDGADIIFTEQVGEYVELLCKR